MKARHVTGSIGAGVRRTPPYRSGSVLILSLWTLFFLAALALAIGARVSAGMRLAGDLQDATVSAAAAQAAIERAIDVLQADTNAWDSLDEGWADASTWPDVALTVAGSADIRCGVPGAEGAWATNGGLGDEECRVSLNRADEPLLAELFVVAGRLGRQDAEALARRTVAWRTPKDDELTAQSGAAYDRDLVVSYAGGAPFSCPEEWRLVKGVDDRLYAACRPYLTVWGDGKVNVNTAGETVLTALGRRWNGEPAVASRLARSIVAFRESGGAFESASGTEMVRRLRESRELDSAESTLLRMLARSVQCRSAFYGGTVEGRVGASASPRYKAEFVVSKEKGQRVDLYEY